MLSVESSTRPNPKSGGVRRWTVIVATAGSAGYFTYRWAFDEAIEAQDVSPSRAGVGESARGVLLIHAHQLDIADQPLSLAPAPEQLLGAENGE